MARSRSTHLIHTAGACACTLAAIVAVAASPAGAQAPQPAPPAPPSQTPTLAVTGTAQVKPKPRDKSSNASIRKAVSVARRKAIPRAIGNGLGRAATLSKASGFPLGRLISITQTSGSQTPFYIGPYYGEDGTFGPGKYCGKVTTTIFRTSSAGARRFAGHRSHRTCRVPTEVSMSLAMVFSSNPAATPVHGPIPFPGPVADGGTAQAAP